MDAVNENEGRKHPGVEREYRGVIHHGAGKSVTGGIVNTREQ